MYLRVGMTRAYPALLLFACLVVLPTIWCLRERVLRPVPILALGTLISFAIAAGVIWNVGIADLNSVHATLDTWFLGVPIFLCFCLFAGWVWRVNRRSESTTQF